jgi:hypothetical protein
VVPIWRWVGREGGLLTLRRVPVWGVERHRGYQSITCEEVSRYTPGRVRDTNCIRPHQPYVDTRPDSRIQLLYSSCPPVTYPLHLSIPQTGTLLRAGRPSLSPDPPPDIRHSSSEDTALWRTGGTRRH